MSFWQKETPVVALTYYACHPQSYYRDGQVTCDFPGLARGIVEDNIDLPLVHFCGAAGNVTAGKYNDGFEEMRPTLARRLADGITQAWEDVSKTPLSPDDVNWATKQVTLPANPKFELEDLAANLSEDPSYRVARKLAWLARCERGHTIPVTRLSLDSAQVLHMPGELFVECQIAAKRMRLDDTVAMAAYGDLGPMYIGTREAYPMGGYEVDKGTFVGPEAEAPLTDAIRDLLNASNTDLAPSDITGEKVRLDAP